MKLFKTVLVAICLMCVQSSAFGALKSSNFKEYLRKDVTENSSKQAGEQSKTKSYSSEVFLKSSIVDYDDPTMMYGYFMGTGGKSKEVYSISGAKSKSTAYSGLVGENGNGGALYAEGKYYIVSYTITEFVTGKYEVYDAFTWKKLSTTSITSFTDFTISATYDETTKTAYCCS